MKEKYKMQENIQLKTITHKVQFCVIGGGMSGICAAIAAARRGVKTLIMQERPMFGGNASSEVRMWICGAKNCMETGIIEEMRLENLYRNPNANYSIWDSVLFEKVQFQENLTSLLNCSCFSVETKDGKIISVTGHQQTTQTYHKIEADYFADCSGDSIVAYLSGADYRIGREEKSEFNETLAQDKTDSKTMGLSCILQAREYTTPQKYIPPKWANKYLDDSSFPERDHTLYKLQNYWWLELGGEDDSIADTETLRDELLKVAYGIWDHIKNHGDHGADNWALDWVCMLPGKRESRRCIGDYIINEKDVLTGGKFDDIIAYGGWPIDDHHPGGFRYFGEPNTNIIPEQPYGIPLRCLYSKNIDNLFFAGRNISATHTALSSTRVMATCSILGQAVGTAVSSAIEHGYLTPRETATKYIKEIQKKLLDDDCYLPGLIREVSPIVANATIEGSATNLENLRNGINRALNGNDNAATCKVNDTITYNFNGQKQLKKISVVFDSNLNRNHLNSLSNYRLDDELFAVPETLVKAYHITCDGVEVFKEECNYQRFNTILVDVLASNITLHIDSTWGNELVKVFSLDVE